jgi:hypothetical protein
MNNQEKILLQGWETPKIFDLTVEKTSSGSLPWVETMTDIGDLS